MAELVNTGSLSEIKVWPIDTDLTMKSIIFQYYLVIKLTIIN